MNEKTIRDTIADTFSYDVSQLLIEFGKHISELDVDYLIFMARKAVRLYDVMVLAGVPILKKPYYSDHILDQHLEMFQDKKIALIDDTLILGTTLGAAKQKLYQIGAKSVSVHVFCLDKTYWCPEVIMPDKCFIEFEHPKMLTFCANEVEALSLSGIPYLTDFPFFDSIRIGEVNLLALQSLINWQSYNISNSIQTKNNIIVYTILPRAQMLETIKSCFGELSYKITDIIKIRAFIRKIKDSYWVKFIPIVTLKPLTSDTINMLFHNTINLLYVNNSKIIKELLYYLDSEKAKLRFMQYIFSIHVGKLFNNELTASLNLKSELKFDLSEITTHYGEWLRDQFAYIHDLDMKGECVYLPGNLVDDTCLIQEAPLPSTFIAENIYDIKRFTNKKSSNIGRPQKSLLTDLMKIFVEFYKTYELPARKEVHRYGSKIFEMDAIDVPHRDRLKYGMAWKVIAEKLVPAQKLNHSLINMLSILLDILIDFGIAVPIICKKKGIYYRAYRHGEDVLYGGQEIALSYDAINGFLQGGGKESIGRIPLEKLLTNLIKLGAEQKILTKIHGMTGQEGIARVGFHIHGSVPFFPGEDTYIADDKDSWLSTQLVGVGAIRYDIKNRNYFLSERPEASLKETDANNKATQLGWLFGKLYNKTHENKKILSDQDFILISACLTPKDTTAALIAEINLIKRWYFRYLRHQTNKHFETLDLKALKGLLKNLRRGFGYTAFNSAVLKYSGYKNEKPKEVIEQCSKYLAELENGMFLSTHWDGLWKLIEAKEAEHQEGTFNPWIDTIGRDIYETGLALYTIELGIISLIVRKSTSQSLNEFQFVYDKADRFKKTMAPITIIDKFNEDRINKAIKLIENDSPAENPIRLISFGIGWMKDKISDYESHSNMATHILKDYGRSDRRFNFNYSIWYDIIDSVGEKSGLKGEELKAYRARILEFKKGVNQDLMSLMNTAKQRNAVLYSFQSELDSFNDEKHVFITGTASITWTKKAIRILFLRANTHNVALRTIIIQADFAGLPAHKYAENPMVESIPFFEHFSRIKKKMEEVELESKLNPYGKEALHSFLWIYGRNLQTQMQIKEHFSWDRYWEGDVRTEIENIPITNKVIGGGKKTNSLKYSG